MDEVLEFLLLLDGAMTIAKCIFGDKDITKHMKFHVDQVQ